MTGQFPLGASIRLADLSVNPYPIFERLRESEPVTWVPELGQWFVTRRNDVLKVLRDRDTFTTDSPKSLLRDLFGAQMLSLEGPRQARHKRQCFPPFRGEALRKDPILEEAHVLIDVLSKSNPAELRTQFCSPLALFSVARILGFPEMDPAVLRAWYEDFAAALANFAGDPEVRERGQATVARFKQMDLLSRAPDDSLLGILAHATIPCADVLSTFTGCWTLDQLGAANRVDWPAVRKYVRECELPDGGFRGGLIDPQGDVEYTFYGLGTLALAALIE